MANIPIWTGTSTFIAGNTPFGFYDNDIIFANDADKVANWCATRLGYPIVNVELQAKQFYTAFEEAITTYGNEVYQYKIRESYLSMEGNLTGSEGYFNNALITPSLGGIIRIAKAYGSEAGSGGTVTYKTGSVHLRAGIQDYDLNAWASSSGISSSIEIKRVFFEGPPAMVRFFDPYAGTGTGIQSLLESFGFGQFSPGINFLLMPISFDVLKVQAIEFNDQIRKAAFSFDLVNNQLRIFPIPYNIVDGFNDKLFFHYIETIERDSVIQTKDSSGNPRNDLISNISKVPFANPIYSQINSIGRQWVYQYALAISKEMLGYVRKKYTTIPIPGAEVTLNGDDLIIAAKEEKAALLEQLRLTLDETSRMKQLERQKNEADFIQSQLSSIPLTFYIF